jgi:hypothetical protein
VGFDEGWIDIGLGWRRVVATWDDARRARLLAHLRRLKAGHWNSKAGLFIAFSLVVAEDEARAADQAKACRRVIVVRRRERRKEG